MSFASYISFFSSLGHTPTVTAECERFYTSDFTLDNALWHSGQSLICTTKHKKHGNIAAKRIENYKIRKRELEIIAGVRPHRNLVRIFGLLYGSKTDTEALGYVMEQMYSSLEEVIDAQSAQAANNVKNIPQYSYEKSIEMAVEICSGVLFLHEANIIHRDIKPSNVLVSEDLAQVKLCDYGVSVIYVENRSLTAAQGTFIYMAPELGGLSTEGVMADRTKYTESCDVYSTAITIYELLGKRRAYADDTKNEVNWNSGFLIFMEVKKGKRPTFHDNTVCPTAKNIIEHIQLKELSAQKIDSGTVHFATGCWSEEPTQRPSIFVVCSELQLILQLVRLFHFNRAETFQQQELNDKTENLPIESFLGEFTADENGPMSLLRVASKEFPVRTIILRKCIVEDYFEVCTKFDNGKEYVSSPWIPDNIQRNEWRYRIEKNVLIRVRNNTEDRFVLLQDNNLICNGRLYTRRDVNLEDKWSVPKTNNTTTKNMPIDAFLGEFMAVEDESRGLGLFGTERLPIHKVIIKNDLFKGYYEIVFKSDSGKEKVLHLWKPDNDERNGVRYRIEKNVLISFYKQNCYRRIDFFNCQAMHYYELTDQGLKLNGNYLYIRV